MTICVKVTCDPLAAETCLTVKPPTDLVCVFVGNQTEDWKYNCYSLKLHSKENK